VVNFNHLVIFLTENRLFATLWIVNHLDAQTELKKRIECLRTTHIKKIESRSSLRSKEKTLEKTFADRQRLDE
jgi:hypothetical protein